MKNWPVRIDEMLAAMARAAHLAKDSNADLLESYRHEIDLIQTIRSELLSALLPPKVEPVECEYCEKLHDPRVACREYAASCSISSNKSK